MSLQVSRESRISPNVRPSASATDEVRLAADLVVTTVAGANSIRPLSTAWMYRCTAARTVRALVPPLGNRFS